ncbi:hypothetical protein [Micromonospora sp. WMMD1155]|uniref:hypothetical protein n=1 Tax=Micromonospora sp. WMMD1155 TaxID=3016094 RepID=UPI00249A60BA|nr:hypothetical protein [Micromonospora sp. WMMD1155]WFE54846.1 hypothetical protein O7617_32790 [Micromonospora sp. WMMD1155]
MSLVHPMIRVQGGQCERIAEDQRQSPFVTGIWHRHRCTASLVCGVSVGTHDPGTPVGKPALQRHSGRTRRGMASAGNHRGIGMPTAPARRNPFRAVASTTATFLVAVRCSQSHPASEHRLDAGDDESGRKPAIDGHPSS